MLKSLTQKVTLLTGLAFALHGCGGAADSNAVINLDDGSIGPHTIALSYPLSDSIEVLPGGFYKRVGTVTVTDSEGNGIAGVTVKFKLIDSILARGTITNGTGEYISSTVIFDTDPLLGDGSTTLTNFADAWVSRTGSIRGISTGDHVLLFNAEAADKRRYVSASVSNTLNLYVSSSYANAYPNSIYDSSTPERTTSYVVGASLLGGYITGTNGIQFQTTTDANGIGTFYVYYPNSANYINAGCSSYVIANDARHAPTGSTQIFITAWVNDDVSAVSNGIDFCFSPVAGGTIEPDGLTVAGGTIIQFRVYDGGDGVPIPYTDVYLNGNLAGFTNVYGYIDITAPASQGQYTVTANRGAKASFTVQ